MSKKETYEAKTEELLVPIVERFQVEIYDVEYVKEAGEWYLRVYIDKPDGVNINDCENVSRALSDVLDEEDYIEEAYEQSRTWQTAEKRQTFGKEHR